MSKVKDTKNKLKSRIEAIKKINDEPSSAVDNLFNKYLKDLPSTDTLYGKKIDDFLEKRRSKIENNKDIFGELMEIAEGFLGFDKKVSSTDKLVSFGRLKQHAQDSANVTLRSSKEIVLDSVKKVFFSGDGICGTDRSITGDTINIQPKEFDFLNMLTIDPTTSTGQIIYEPTKISGKEKVNRKLYQSFTGGTYQFDSNNNNTLFGLQWSGSSQTFVVTGLTANANIEEFFNDYFSSIEFPDIKHITKTAMLLTVQGDNSESIQFNDAINKMNRLLKKLFAVCGTPTKRNQLQNQTAIDLFDENDEDLEFYFNFDEVEGIDLDDEDARLRKVQRFTDCNNFEIPVNTSFIEDFVYLSTKKDTNSLVNSTLNRIASDAYNQSDSNIPEINFNINLNKNFILNLPKAIMMNVLSAKITLPIVLMYKYIKSQALNFLLTAQEIMKKLWKLFSMVISKLYWLFIKEFWRLIKVDLVAFISKIVKKIIKNKYKRYVTIITSLIALLTKIIEDGVDNCYDLFNSVLNAIETALSTKSPFNVPGILLSLADTLPGYSQDRALLNITERLESAGISMGPIFGEGNDLPTLVKSIIDGHTEEMDANSFVKISVKPGILPGPSGGAIIPPGIINGTGKIF